MQTVNNNHMSKKELLDWINQVSFALTDLSLFLDTHPCDTEALVCFEKYNEERQRALTLYSNQYGPLIMDTINDSNHWYWSTTSWPWEGEC
jgi:spore coat protein JB